MLRIRFQRVGKKNQPFFRLVVIEKGRSPRGGRFEKLGFFNPLTKEKGLRAERIKYWLSVGAQPSDRVYNLLVDEKIIEGKKKAVHARPKKAKGSQEETTEKPANEGSAVKAEEKAEEKVEEKAEEKEEEKVKDSKEDSETEKAS